MLFGKNSLSVFNQCITKVSIIFQILQSNKDKECELLKWLFTQKKKKKYLPQLLPVSTTSSEPMASLPTLFCLDWVIFLNDSPTNLFPEKNKSPSFFLRKSFCSWYQQLQYFPFVLRFWDDTWIMLAWILTVLVPASRIQCPDHRSWPGSLLLMT